MAYSEKAKQKRRCKHVHPDGRACKAWAVWDDARQLCNVHAGRHHRGPMLTPDERIEVSNYEFATGAEVLCRHAKPKPCKCVAYAWPHRPGGGLCRWPDPPVYRRTTPPSTHKPGRLRPPRFLTRMGIHTVKQANRAFGI